MADQKATPNQEPGAQEVGAPTPSDGESSDRDDSTSGLAAGNQHEQRATDAAVSDRPSSDDDKGTSGQQGDGETGDGDFTYGEDESQDFVDRSKIDFDPADGLYTGSAVEGDSDIPGPSEADIRAAQEELGDDEGTNAGEKAAAEKYIEENDVDVEEAQKGEAISGSAQGGPSSDDSQDSDDADHSGDTKDSDGDRAESSQGGADDEEHPKPFPHDGKGPDE
ncbi:MAG: hypothetical protein ACR2LX_15390 [Jatrophihabitans sp.]